MSLDGGEVVSHGVPESDWKVFRELREAALQRFCKRVLDEVPRIAHDRALNHHDRYGEDKQLAHAFDNASRSRMIDQLVMIHALDLLSPSDLERFTPETRSRLERLANVGES